MKKIIIYILMGSILVYSQTEIKILNEDEIKEVIKINKTLSSEEAVEMPFQDQSFNYYRVRVKKPPEFKEEIHYMKVDKKSDHRTNGRRVAKKDEVTSRSSSGRKINPIKKIPTLPIKPLESSRSIRIGDSRTEESRTEDRRKTVDEIKELPYRPIRPLETSRPIRIGDSRTEESRTEDRRRTVDEIEKLPPRPIKPLESKRKIKPKSGRSETSRPFKGRDVASVDHNSFDKPSQCAGDYALVKSLGWRAKCLNKEKLCTKENSRKASLDEFIKWAESVEKYADKHLEEKYRNVLVKIKHGHKENYQSLEFDEKKEIDNSVEDIVRAYKPRVETSLNDGELSIQLENFPPRCIDKLKTNSLRSKKDNGLYLPYLEVGVNEREVFQGGVLPKGEDLSDTSTVLGKCLKNSYLDYLNISSRKRVKDFKKVAKKLGKKPERYLKEKLFGENSDQRTKTLSFDDFNGEPVVVKPHGSFGPYDKPYCIGPKTKLKLQEFPKEVNSEINQGYRCKDPLKTIFPNDDFIGALNDIAVILEDEYQINDKGDDRAGVVVGIKDPNKDETIGDICSIKGEDESPADIKTKMDKLDYISIESSKVASLARSLEKNSKYYASKLSKMQCSSSKGRIDQLNSLLKSKYGNLNSVEKLGHKLSKSQKPDDRSHGSIIMEAASKINQMKKFECDRGKDRFKFNKEKLNTQKLECQALDDLLGCGHSVENTEKAISKICSYEETCENEDVESICEEFINVNNWHDRYFEEDTQKFFKRLDISSASKNYSNYLGVLCNRRKYLKKHKDISVASLDESSGNSKCEDKKDFSGSRLEKELNDVVKKVSNGSIDPSKDNKLSSDTETEVTAADERVKALEAELMAMRQQMAGGMGMQNPYMFDLINQNSMLQTRNQMDSMRYQYMNMNSLMMMQSSQMFNMMNYNFMTNQWHSPQSNLNFMNGQYAPYSSPYNYGGYQNTNSNTFLPAGLNFQNLFGR